MPISPARGSIAGAFEPPPSLPQPRQPLIALDLLRTLAALEVVLFHVRREGFVEFGALPIDQQSPFVAVPFVLTQLGREAVLVFFVLSGFLVGGQIISRLQCGSFRLADYAVDRSTRILLPLIPACLLTEAINVLVFHRPDRMVDFLASTSGLNGVVGRGIAGNGVLWTLSYEIWFYIAGGACAVLLSARNGAAAGRALAVAGICAVIFSRLEARYLLYWVVGALAVFCLQVKYRRSLALAGGAVALAAVWQHQTAWIGEWFAPRAIVLYQLSEAGIAVGLALMMPALCSDGLNRRFHSVRQVAAMAAGCSYSLYLIHAPLLFLMRPLLPRAAAITANSLEAVLIRLIVIAIGVAAFYWCFERNTNRLRRWLRGRIRSGDTRLVPAGGVVVEKRAGSVRG